jgi:hypothetical protein
MTHPKVRKTDLKEVPWATRTELAIDTYKEVLEKEGRASIVGIAKEYRIAWEAYAAD